MCKGTHRRNLDYKSLKMWEKKDISGKEENDVPDIKFSPKKFSK